MAQAGSAERGAGVRFPPPLVFLFSLLSGVAVDRYWMAAPLPIEPTIRMTLGMLVALSGFSLLLSSRIHFKRTGQSVSPWKPTPELIFRWPYTFTRNPMYVGMTLVEIGLGIALNNRWIAAFAVPALLLVHFIAVLPEEKYLSEKFGDSYRTYLTKVRRYL